MASLPDDPTTVAERRLLDVAELDAGVDLTDADGVVRASFLRQVLLGLDTSCRRAGVKGGRIAGDLDLEACTLPCALKFEQVRFDGEVVLLRARVPRLELAGCTMQRLNAPRLTLEHALVLNGSTVEDAIVLDGAAIPGGLDCRGVSIGAGGLTLVRGTADAVLVSEGFECRGAVQLGGTVIEGALNGSRATFDAAPKSLSLAGGKAATVLMADARCSGAVDLSDCVVGDVFCTGEFDALDLSDTEAQSVMLGASEHPIRCRGPVDLTAGRYASVAVGPGEIEHDPGVALALARAAVAGNVSLQDLDVAGTLGLGHAAIGGMLLWRHLSVRWEHAPPDDGAVFAVSTTVGDFVIEGSEIVGGTGLTQLSVSGRLAIRESRFVKPEGIALGVVQGTVGRALQLADVDVQGALLLDDTDVQTLADDLGTGPDRMGSWSASSWLSLDGFTYGQFGEGGSWDDTLRHAWLKRTFVYQPSAWHQLADAYRRSGWDREATRTSIAMQNDRLARGRLPFHRKLGRRVLRATIGHGYRPSLAGVWALAIIAAFAAVVAAERERFLPAGAPAPELQPVVYAADTFLPIVNLGVADAWVATGWVAWLAWSVILLGWALTTLFVAGFTRAVRS
jgi:hypothetical protein